MYENLFKFKIENGEATITGCKKPIYNDVIIPSTLDGYPVTSIGDEAFAHRYLRSIVIPDSVTSIGYGAFQKCGLLTSVTIPDSVTSIGDSAFWGCSVLTKVNITNLAAWCNISFGGHFANPLRYAKNLYLNGELITDLIIPDCVTNIGSYAFMDCNSFTSITIPNGVTSIGKMAFMGCKKLASIIIPDSVTSIGHYAFYGCSSLKSIEIPDGVTSIGDSVFDGCDSLTNITIHK